ncbi:MAG: NAD(P)H-binding protein [Pseudomonadota bacterium]
MIIAVTTASGQLGKATIRALQDAFKDNGQGHQIIGLARTPAKAKDLGVEIRPGDYDAPDQWINSLAGVDALLLISGNQAPGARVGQHRNVINAAKTAGVRKIVFTSVQGIDGAPEGSVGASFLQTEADVQASGLEWAIGRNGVYIEPDLDYIDTYAAAGEIANSAGVGRYGYTTRRALGYAYAQMLIREDVNGQRFNLNGTALTQAELAAHMSKAFGVPLTYRAMSPEAYLQDRIAELGPELGPIIAGIYDKIRSGGLDHPSDYETAAGRAHETWESYFASRSMQGLTRGEKL